MWLPKWGVNIKPTYTRINVSAEALSDVSRDSAVAAAEPARRINLANIKAPRNQPKTAKPGIPGPVATSRSRSSGLSPARLLGGFKFRMLNKRDTTAVANADAAIDVKEPRSCQRTDSNKSAIETEVDTVNQPVTS